VRELQVDIIRLLTGTDKYERVNMTLRWTLNPGAMITNAHVSRNDQVVVFIPLIIAYSRHKAL
jgi:hypothetical protein